MFTQDQIDDLNSTDYSEEMFAHMIEYGIATEEEISLTTSVAGWNPDTMNAILYYKTGFRNLGQILEQNGLLEYE